MRQQNLSAATATVELEAAQARFTRGVSGSILILVMATLWLVQHCRAEEDPAKAYDAQLNQLRSSAESRSVDTSKMTATEKKAYDAQTSKAKAAADKKKNLADFKEKTANNLSSIKEMFTKAEDAWKNKKYHDAGT